MVMLENIFPSLAEVPAEWQLNGSFQATSLNELKQRRGRCV